MSNLKPCPFCGSDNAKHFGYDAAGEPEHFVQCLECSTTGPYAEDETSAVEHWNRRAVMSNAVAYEFHHQETGHAIVDYSEHTHAGHLSAEKGYTAKPLVYANDA